MPKQNAIINDFSAGLIDSTNARDIPINALSQAKNVSFTERKSIKQLGGAVEHTKLKASAFSGATGGDGSAGSSVIEGHIAAGYGLFAFESDFDIGLTAPTSIYASGADDQGSKHIMYMDCVNGEIHWYDYNTRTLNLRGAGPSDMAVPNGTIENYSFGANKLAFTAAGTTDVGDSITDDDNSFIGKFKAGSYLRIEGTADNSNANNFQCLRVRDVNRSKVTFDHKAFFTTDANESSGATIYQLIKPVWYYAENAVRISDASYFEVASNSDTGATNAFQNVWYGYIKRTHFQDGSGGTRLTTDNNAIFDGWDKKKNDLAAPTYLAAVGSEAYPSGNGTGFNLRVVATGSLASSSWMNKTYQLAVSYIYDGNQESLLYIPSSNNTIAPGSDNQKLTLEIYANGAYNSRISGARIYARENETDDPWFLVVDMDLSTGTRTTLSEPRQLWEGNSSATQARSYNIFSSDINLETYEILNGFSPDEQKISISGNGEGYATAVVANRRTFIANMRTENEEGKVVQMRDRIMYSPVGRFDTFPRSYFIDVIKGDAGEFVHLESFGDRLLAYKQDRLFIINIGSPSPANWFLEQIKEYGGCQHPGAVQKTEFGVMWANNYGFWIYNGQSFANLIDGKISESTWESFFTNGTIVGYNPKYNYALLLKDSITTTTSEALVYDFRTGGWTEAPNSIYDVSSDYGSGVVTTNMIVDHDNNLTFGIQRQKIGNDQNSTSNPDETIKFIEWSETSKGGIANGDSLFVTKDFDFGDPGRVKRFYKVIITYKSTAAMTTPISYSVDGGESYTNLTGNFANTSGAWDVLTATPSSPFSGQSIKIKVSMDTGDGVEINDITIVHRTIKKNPT